MKVLLKTAGMATLAILFMAGAVANAETPVPKVGDKTKHQCKGPYGKEILYTVSEVNGDNMRVEIDRDGKAEWVEKPLNARGLSLFSKRQRNDGKGVRKQKLDDDLLVQIAEYKPGSKFKFNVRERHNEGRWEWGYEVEIGAPKMITHPTLGEIEVIPVSEKRKVWQGSYSSELEVLLSTKDLTSVSSTYKDSTGTQQCEQVEVN